MASEKGNSNKSSGSRPKNAVNKTPSTKKKIPKNILQFENLISGFSAALIDTPHESLESELKSWLKKFVEFLKVDRCIVDEYLDDKKTIHLLMNYTVPEIDTVAVVNNFKPSSGVIRELEKGIIIKAEKIPEDLPRMFRGGVIERDKTRSVVIVPLITGNKVIGSLAFSCYRKERKWSDDLIRRIKLIGEIIANAILRIRSHKSLYQEMELRKTLENRYFTILKYANVGFIISDLNHNILEVNEEYCRMSGFTRDEILAKKIWEIDASMDPEKLGKEGQELEKNKVMRLTTSHIRKDGTLFDVEVNGTFLKEEGIACTFVRDITDLNKTRKQLEERLEFEELVSEFSNTFISIKPDDISETLNLLLKKFVELFKIDRGVICEYMRVPSAVKILTSYTAADLITDPLEESYSIPDSLMEEYERGVVIRAERLQEDLHKDIREWALRENIASFVIIPLVSGDQIIGNITLASHRAARNWSDEFIKRIKLISEIIANAILRMRSQKSLLEEVERREMLEQNYSSAIKNANLGFMIVDTSEHSIIDVNDEYCRMSGYSRDELINKKTWEIDASMDPDKVRKDAETGLKQGSVHLETSHIRKDGSLFDVEVSSNIFRRDDEVVYSFIRDITDLNHTRKELEERLEFEKLSSEFSTTLINIAPDQIYNELNNWLKKLVEFLKVDRGIINEHLYEENVIHLLMNYTVPGIDIPLIKYHKIPGGVRNDFLKGRSFKAEKIPEDLPEGFKGGLMEKEGVKSAIIVPTIANNEVIGNLTFLSYRNELKWPDEIVRRIKLMGEIIANAILRKRSHDALTEEMEQRKLLEERYTSVIKNADLGFMVSDMNSIILDVNDAYCEMSGYSRDELLGMSVEKIDASLLDQNELTPEKEEILKKSGLFIETHHRRKDGIIIDVALTSNFLEKEELIFNFIRDITASNQAKKEQTERLKFEEVVSEFSTALINIKPDDIINELGKWLEKFVGLIDADRGAVNEYSDDQQVIKNLIQYSIPEVHTSVPDERKTPEGEIFELEKGIIRVEKIPEELPQMFRGTYVEKGRAKSLIIVPLLTGNRIFGNLAFTNIRKERKWSDELIRRIKLIGEIVGNAILRLRAHDALIEEMKSRHLLEEKYTSIIKTANVGFWIADLNARILEVNDAYCKMSGYSRDELLGMTIDQIDQSLNPENKISDTNRILASGNFNIETRHTRKDGTVIEVAVNSSVLEKEGIIFTFIRDITELNKIRSDLEDRLKFEELNSQFSAALVNVKPDRINEELKHWVKKFVEFIRVDRGIFHEYDYDNKAINILVSYTDPEVNVIAAPLRESHQAPDEIMREFTKGTVIRAEKIPGDLPPLFQGGVLERHNTKSIVIVPLTAGDKVIGNLTFVNYRKEREWSDELIRRIKLIGEIVANAILRVRSHEALLEEMERREMLEERYSSIIKTANVGFMISDMNANILEVNDAYCEMSGYNRDELLGMKIYQLDISGSPDKVDGDKDGIFETGSFHHETSHIRKDGKIIKVLISANFLEKEGIIFSFVRDVTELNIAREDMEERLKFEELVTEFSAALINVKIQDIKNELNLWLRRFAELMNVERCAIGQYEKDFSIFRFICTYSNPGLEPEPPPFPSTIINDERYGLEKILMNGDFIKIESPSDELPYSLNTWKQKILNEGTKSLLMLPLMGGDVLLGSMVMATLTHEKKWTQELVRRLKLVVEIFANALMREKTDTELDNYRKHLEEMVEERTARLEEAQKELVLSEKMATLGRLTATVSHELRNPLGTIRSSVFSVQRRLEGQNEKVVNALDRAERNIKRCDLIIDELLNYSRLHDLHLEPTSIDEWISEVLEETMPPEGISIKKELDSNQVINMDRERFRRSMVNILTNAYQAIQEKGGDKQGYVNVTAYKDGENLIIEIIDNGIGFDMENKSKIFEPLYSTKTFGVGLGVPITRQIIEQHGWNMDIIGEPHKGASVIITIPL